MATIIFSRTREYLNGLVDYSIYIDGKKVGSIASGETKEFNVPAGQHSIFAKIDWCSSLNLSVDINDQETKRFKIGGFKNGNWLLPTGLIIFLLSYIAKLLFHFEYLFYLVIPIFLLLFYYLTVGRKQYLTLTENKSVPQKEIVLQ